MKTIKKINGELLSEDECYQKHNKLIYKALKPFLLFAKDIGVDPEDLVSEGTIGFIKAYRRFDETLGYRFSSYATRMVKFEAMKYIRDKGKSVKHPRTAIELANKINTSGLEECTKKEIAVKLNESEKNVQAAFESMEGVVSLNNEIFGNSEKATRLDQLGTEADFTSIYVKEFIDILEPVEKTIINMRLEDYNQTEIGSEIGVTQMQVSRRLKKIGEKYMDKVM